MREVGIAVTRYSSLYETLPVGITEQPDFLNAAVLAKTEYQPNDLLQNLKKIEKKMGRNFNERRYGPRLIDLDIIFYGNKNHNDENLTIPHPRWRERDFVKIPLLDLATGYSVDQPHSSDTVQKPLEEVREMMVGAEAKGLQQVCTLGQDRIEQLGQSTWMMLILNITPDSFSDGGGFLSSDEHLQNSAILECAHKAVDHGVKILDIGGQSTRPGSVLVSPEKELQRVLPVIKLLRATLGDACPYISIDTFYSSVAKEAVAAGADIINDISGGRIDEEMLHTAAELKVPMVLMHMRGTPQTMTLREHMLYSPDPIKDIGFELQAAAYNAMEAGIPSWCLTLDPGIGFSKSAETSFSVILELQRLKKEILRGACAKMPLLIGHSRKRFLSAFSNKKTAKERDLVSSAIVLDCIRNGADIVRMHNCEMTREVIAVADALYRTRRLP